MVSGIAEYSRRSANLLTTARRLSDSLGDDEMIC
jgi:hypothetical protein